MRYRPLFLVADRMREERYRRLFGVLIILLCIGSLFFWLLHGDRVAAFLTWVVAVLIWLVRRRWFNDPP
jgi:hypothetical protein